MNERKRGERLISVEISRRFLFSFFLQLFWCILTNNNFSFHVVAFYKYVFLPCAHWNHRDCYKNIGSGIALKPIVEEKRCIQFSRKEWKNQMITWWNLPMYWVWKYAKLFLLINEIIHISARENICCEITTAAIQGKNDRRTELLFIGDGRRDDRLTAYSSRRFSFLNSDCAPFSTQAQFAVDIALNFIPPPNQTSSQPCFRLFPYPFRFFIPPPTSFFCTTSCLSFLRFNRSLYCQCLSTNNPASTATTLILDGHRKSWFFIYTSSKDNSIRIDFPFTVSKTIGYPDRVTSFANLSRISSYFFMFL